MSKRLALFCLFAAGCGLWLAAGNVARADDADQLRPWDEYRVIMWIGDSIHQKPGKFPLFLQRLQEMGVNTGMVYDGADPKPFVDAKFPYYVENIVNRGLCLRWNSKVRDWDKFVEGWRKTRSKDAFIREYCLDDPKWLDYAQSEMRTAARRNGSHQPLAYCLRDELSITISANPFDFDFSPPALKGFQTWLKTQYKDLDALNKAWETHFGSWEAVRPFSTDEIKNRMASGDAQPRGQPDWQAVQKLRFDPAEARKQPTRWNLSPWCDFRTYMDISLARTLGSLRQSAHEVDPHTPVGIEGTQMPHAFGGYDLYRLSQVLDWVEPYDVCNARAIFGSFMPGKPVLCTIGEKDPKAAGRRLWHLLLEGDRGCLIWWSEDCIDFKSDDLALTPRAKILAPLLKDMQGPLARVFLRAERVYDPIAIHYSQASIQVHWLLDSIPDGSRWIRRFSSFEADHSEFAKVRNRCLQAFREHGYSPRFVAAEQIEKGELRKGSYKLLALPSSLALSDKEMTEIRTMTPKSVLWDKPPGSFDEHGRLRSNWPLRDFLPPAADARETMDWHKAVQVASQIVPQEVTLFTPAGESADNKKAAIYRYRFGKARLIAVESNITWHMTEDLKQKEKDELAKPTQLEARFNGRGHVYDLRTKKYLGETDRFTFMLEPWQPSLFAVLPERVPAGNVVESLLKSSK